MRFAALLILALPVSEAAATEIPRAAAVSVHAGAYRMIDRNDAMYDGPEAAVRATVPIDGAWSGVGELGAAGEFAGGRGTCLGELSLRAGPSLTLTPGSAWLHLLASAGGGAGFARLYGSLFGGADQSLVASGDRWLPLLWSSLGAAASVAGRWAVSVEIVGRWMPRATFHADRLPNGTTSEFFPVFRRAHELSTFGGSLGGTFRF
jgi:hypothetical protein